MFGTRLSFMLLLLHCLRINGLARVFTSEAHRQRIKNAYNDVRSDDADIMWTAIVYEGRQLGEPITGTEYKTFLDLCTADDRVYGYMRFETGDEMSRRAKFAFITWIGGSVTALKKAAVSTDKAFVKVLWPDFGKEFLADEFAELKYKAILKDLEKASGAAYGTGKN